MENRGKIGNSSYVILSERRISFIVKETLRRSFAQDKAQGDINM